MEDLKLKRCAEYAQKFFAFTKKTFANSTNPNIKTLAAKVPNSFTEGDKKISVVFAGEYASGKSTIISLLTGMKLEIGGGVTTQKCSSFDWNGVTIIDTPGVHNQGRPDHDAITYDAIAKADLIIFVTTVKGFSNHVGSHFRELIIDRHKGREMMLVVNKMSSMNDGNTPELQREIRDKTFLPVVSPDFKPEDFYISYVDAESYKESLLERDPAAKRELEQESGWAKLVANINKFIADKKTLGKTTTTLFRLEQLICDAKAEFKSGDVCVDGSIGVLNGARRIYSEAANNIRRKCKDLASAQSGEIYRVRDKVVSQINISSTQQQLEDNLKSASNDAEQICNGYICLLNQAIDAESKSIDQKLGNFANSPFVGQLKSAIENSYNISFDSNGGKLPQAANIAKKAGRFGDVILKLSTKNPNSTIFQIFKSSCSSGTKMHDTVLKVGHFFGHKFRPWGATNFARDLAVGGKVLGAVGSLSRGCFRMSFYAQREEARASACGSKANCKP